MNLQGSSWPTPFSALGAFVDGTWCSSFSHGAAIHNRLSPSLRTQGMREANQIALYMALWLPIKLSLAYDYSIRDDPVVALKALEHLDKKLWSLGAIFINDMASPTTLGKEMAIFAFRLSEERKKISKVELLGKFAGAVGNYNAHIAAYPLISTGLRDIWDYISLGYSKQVNTQNCFTMEFAFIWQRDLTDSTGLRNMGEGLGHSLLACKSTLQGIGKLQVNEARLNEDLNCTWEVLAKPIQTVMRRYGFQSHMRN